VVHTYAGYEQRVKDNLRVRIETLDAEDRIHEVVIPTEEVTEFKKGKKTVSQKKFLPGYVLVRMDMDDETWNIVRHTPAVTGFVGATGSKPVPLSLREVAATLKLPDQVVEETEDDSTEVVVEKSSAAEIDLEVGETIRVTTGPFADFTGTISRSTWTRQSSRCSCPCSDAKHRSSCRSTTSPSCKGSAPTHVGGVPPPLAPRGASPWQRKSSGSSNCRSLQARQTRHRPSAQHWVSTA
jgi:transcription termination/antitermination factor NusG